MTNFEAAVKLPFSDWKKYLIGAGIYFVVCLVALISIGMMILPTLTATIGGYYEAANTYYVTGVVLSIVAAIIALFPSGYFLRCIKNTSEGKFVLPEWKNWGDLFAKGLLLMIIILLYLIPIYIINIIQAVFPNAILAIILTVIMVIYYIVFYYIMPMIWAKFVNEGFKAAFDIKNIFKRAFTTKYFVGILGIIGITLIIGIIFTALFFLLFTTGIGVILVPFLYGLGYMALYIMIAAIAGQLYRETSTTAAAMIRKPIVVTKKMKKPMKIKKAKPKTKKKK